MRPILLGCAALAMFVGGVIMAPLTSDIASPIHVVDSAPAVPVLPPAWGR